MRHCTANIYNAIFGLESDMTTTELSSFDRLSGLCCDSPKHAQVCLGLSHLHHLGAEVLLRVLVLQ